MLAGNGQVRAICAADRISERHRHCYEVSIHDKAELKSKRFDPHPLFASFIEAVVKQSRLV